MGDKYLSDVIDVDAFVKLPENKICIMAGVGAGKNVFVEEKLCNYGNILYVSSRRAKVNEILTNENFQEKICWDKESNDVVVTTNYGIQLLVQNMKFGCHINDIIEHFDYIVVDEAHSIFTDSTYTESSFHLYKFIEYVSEKFPAIKIILMTGTPEPMEKMLQSYLILDKRDECISVIPQTIREISFEEALKYMREMKSDEKTIYYANSATRLVKGKKSLLKLLYEDNKYDESEIAFCMSESSCFRLRSAVPQLREKCKKLKEYISKNEKLPDETRVLLTTSTLKEGVNIKEDDIKIVFCESHVLSDIQQFAGRVRNGVDVLYVITDARQHFVTKQMVDEGFLELLYDVNGLVKNTNEFLKNFIEDSESLLYKKTDFEDSQIDMYRAFFEGDISLYSLGGDACQYFIDFVQDKNQYIKFNHLRGEFEIDRYKYLEQRRINRILDGFEWSKQLEKFCEKSNIVYIPSAAENAISRDEIIDYLQTLGTKIYVDEEKEEILDMLRYFLVLPAGTRRTSINKELVAYRINFEVAATYTTRNKVKKRGIKIIGTTQ